MNRAIGAPSAEALEVPRLREHLSRIFQSTSSLKIFKA